MGRVAVCSVVQRRDDQILDHTRIGVKIIQRGGVILRIIFQQMRDHILDKVLDGGVEYADVMRVWLYARLSRDEDEELNSLTNQRKIVYEYAVAKEYEIIGESFDDNISGMRILGDSIAFAVKAEGYLRQILTKAGVDVPARVDLELAKYLDNRGSKKLRDKPEQEFKDPLGVQHMPWGALAW